MPRGIGQEIVDLAQMGVLVGKWPKMYHQSGLRAVKFMGALL